ncbi:MAG: nitronate monooxygenase, partial [Solirubrobacteraceae bacterium]
YKQRVLAAAETDAIHTRLFDVGWPQAPHRVLPNSTVAAWERAGRPEPGARPGEGEIVATTSDGHRIARYDISEPMATMTGELEALAHYAGQSAGLMHEIKPVGAIVRGLVEEAEAILRQLSGS